MLTISAGRMAEVTGGALVAGSPDRIVQGCCIDSRCVTSGCAFIALPGEHVDGHAFADAALRSGAHALVVTRWDEEMRHVLADAAHREATVVLVADATAALEALAIHHRAHLHCTVVGVTGSTGKTTTKDFLVAAIGTQLRVSATRGNRNNELGVPLTILDADADTQVLIVEMGMRGAGQIAALCALAQPTMGLVTNVGQAHIEMLGTQEAILHAKGELVACVPAGGHVFLNGDDVWSRRLAATSAAEVVYYGLEPDDDVRATDVSVGEDGCATITLRSGRHHASVLLPVPGRHNAYNAAAAAAVAVTLGLSLKDVAAGLAAAVGSVWRMQVLTTATGVTVVNDAYNANPASMRAALATLVEMAGVRRIAVLGGMAELGSLTDLAHFELGERVGRAGVDALVTVGPLGRRIAEGALAAGMSDDDVRTCATPQEASEVLDDLLEPGDVVLVKASRSVGMEHVVEGIVQPHA